MRAIERRQQGEAGLTEATEGREPDAPVAGDPLYSTGLLDGRVDHALDRLDAELSPGHALEGRDHVAAAVADYSDDTLFFLGRAAEPWALVHPK